MRTKILKNSLTILINKRDSLQNKKEGAQYRTIKTMDNNSIPQIRMLNNKNITFKNLLKRFLLRFKNRSLSHIKLSLNSISPISSRIKISNHFRGRTIHFYQMRKTKWSKALGKEYSKRIISSKCCLKGDSSKIN